MGSLRHFFFYMGMAAVGGAVTGILSNTWSWGPEMRLAAMAIGIVIVGTLATREVLFAPGPKQRTPTRASK